MTWREISTRPCGKTRSLARKMGVKKVGHCGTLDPMATGLLILCLGKATKMVDEFVGMDKCYSGTMKLGEGTPSQDAETEADEVVAWEGITDSELAAGAAGMCGEIAQIPPMAGRCSFTLGSSRLVSALEAKKMMNRCRSLLSIPSCAPTACTPPSRSAASACTVRRGGARRWSAKNATLPLTVSR